jgi:Protein of unknown function (DUF3300)
MATPVRGLRSQLTAVICSMLLVPGGPRTTAAELVAQQTPAPEEQAPKIPADQLDSLVAPVALYADPLLAQVLAASTYPLELIQLKQWLDQNKNLKDKALVDAAQKQDWDASVQAMAMLPDVVKRLTEDIKWTTDLGNAFLAQQSDVMDAVQRMRAKAQDKGSLKTNEQMKVETKVVESKSVIVIQQAKPEVIYAPSYDPVVVYGPPAYPYPPTPPGYYAAGAAISFGVGMMVGAAMSGGWGWGCGWGGNNNVTINNNNNFVNNSNRSVSNRQNVNAGNRTGNNSWQHNPQHRGGAPYSNKATANKYGGAARGDSTASRQANARQNQGQRVGGQQAGNLDRGGGLQPGASSRTAGGAGGADRASGGGDRVGNRSVSSSASGGSRGGGGALGGVSSGEGGKSARASSSRGASSMGASRSRGGGGRRR